MFRKPIFLSVEPANFEFQLRKKIEEKFEYTEKISTQEEYKRVRVIYIRFSQRADQTFLEKFENCKFLLCNATGIEHIDEDACLRLGIRVISLRGETRFLEKITATAELTWFLVLALARNAVEATLSVRQGLWDRNEFIGMQLRGKTIGIAGLGRNGRKLIEYAKAFEMQILSYDPYVEQRKDVNMCESLNDLCARSDIVCITLNFNKTTKLIFDSKVLSSLRPHALLVNTARGEVVDEKFILSLLEYKKIGGYGTDVISNELQFNHNPLVSAAKNFHNLIITPHIGGVTQDSWRSTEQFVVERMLSIYESI